MWLHFDKLLQFKLTGPLKLKGEANGCIHSHCELLTDVTHMHLTQLLTCTRHHIKTSLSFSIKGRQHDSTLKDYCERI